MFVAFFIERLGRTGAFNLSTLGWVPCGLLLLGTGALAGVPGMAWDASQGSLVGTVGDGCCTTLRAPLAGEQLNGGACCCPCVNSPTPWLAPAACTLARDESAMQHRLKKVLSSYTFSAAALDRMAEQEQQEQQLDGEGGGASEPQQDQQRNDSSIGRHSSSGSLRVERAPP